MTEKRIRGILITTIEEANEYDVVSIPNCEDEFVRILKADYIERAPRNIGRINYEIIIDGNRESKDNLIITACCLSDCGKDYIIGSILIVKADEKNRLISLDEKDIDHIIKHIKDKTLYYLF